MNLGIYIDTFSDFEFIKQINELINIANKNSKVYDISLFFNEPGYNPYNMQCGIFNSTELWSFNGTLLVFNCRSAELASKSINNIQIYYYYGLEQKEYVLNLVTLDKNIKYIANNNTSQEELYRLTGNKTIGICSLENTLDLIMEQYDGYQSNINYVYQTQ